MPTYTTATLATFKKNLEDGKYADQGRANKAIARMTSLSDAQKTRARNLAAEYFNKTQSTATKAKNHKKKTAKKKAAKRSKKKVAKKAAAKKTTRRSAPKKKAVAKKTTAKKAAKGKRQQTKRAVEKTSMSVAERISVENDRVKGIEAALNLCERTKKLGGSDVKEHALEAQKGLMRSIHELSTIGFNQGNGTITEEDKKQAEMLQKAARAAGVTNGDDGQSGPAMHPSTQLTDAPAG